MRVLAVGAHPDDIEIGCGGTLVQHRNAGDEITLLVMTAGELGPQGRSSVRRDEQASAADLLGAHLLWAGFTDGNVPGGIDGAAVIEDVVLRSKPDVVYTHTPHDSHQDHRATAAATLSASRRTSRVLCYESPSSLRFSPSAFVDVAQVMDEKLGLIRAHWSQVLGTDMVDEEVLWAQARMRGFAGRVRMAEAFEVPRLLVDPTAYPEDQIAGDEDRAGISAADCTRAVL
jgi:LmbE family N-acetylglucosaminyl deacetylase